MDILNSDLTGAGGDVSYESLCRSIAALMEGESDLIANLANVAAAIREAKRFWWVGFYLVKEGELVLGPFQGPVACTRIPFGKGVCGASYSSRQTIVVPDVDSFPGHIACSAVSKSEIVIPVFHRNGTVAMVLDIDSELSDRFQAEDQRGLERIVRLLEKKM
jgi:L-methionine (R)-S-oxide reductase